MLITLALVLGIVLWGDAMRAAPPGETQQETKRSGRGWLGVSIQDMTPRLARSMHLKTESGALVSDVIDDSPAEDAGIHEEDVIVEFNGSAVKDADDVRAAVRHTPPGTQVAVTLQRGDDRKSVQVKIGKAPRATAFATTPIPPMPPRVFRFETNVLMGLTLRTLNGQLGHYFQAPGGHGVLVEEVEEESEAAKAGFQAGDVITGAGTEQVEEVRDVRRAMRNADEGDNVTFDILRRGSQQKLSLKVEDQGEARSYHFRSNMFDDGEFDDLEDLDELNDLQLKLEMENLRPHMEDLRRGMRELRIRLHDLKDSRS
jgi:serine protease Do